MTEQTTEQNPANTQDIKSLDSFTRDELLHKIKQLNYALAAATGRLDVVSQYIDKARANGKGVDYEFEQFMIRTNRQMDQMLARISRHEDAIL